MNIFIRSFTKTYNHRIENKYGCNTNSRGSFSFLESVSYYEI
jgi:hypothetical protein